MLLSEIDVATQGEFMARILRSLSEEADLLRTIRALMLVVVDRLPAHH